MASNKKLSRIFNAALGVVGLVTMSLQTKIENPMPANESLYDISIKSLDGKDINLADYKGKKILFVNVASECGFTPQYAGLQKLHEEYGDKVTIIGVPCNQFGGQEPGTHDEIAAFCERNYGVTFLITEKVDVKGENQHPLYAWLTQKDKNGVLDSEVKWNFQKYLISETGELLEMFSTRVKPMDDKVINAISE